MKKIVFMIMLLLLVVLATNVYAADGTTAWQGFWNSVGGFFHNAMPWNWGHWATK